MRARVVVWLLAVGLGLLALSVPFAGRASAATKTLCIGPTGAFVTCGRAGQGSVLPSPSTTVGGSGTTRPTTRPTTLPTTPTTVPVPTSIAPPKPAGVLSGQAVLSHGEDTDVVVIGTLVAIALGVELVALVVLSPRRMRRPVGPASGGPVGS